MTEPEDVRCERCHRPLKDTDSRARGYGPVCADIVLGVDTHRTPVPRAEHPADPNQIPLPLEDTVSDEVTRVLDAAKAAALEAALGVPQEVVRAIVRSVFLTLDDLIEEAEDRDIDWPTTGDLALLAGQLKPAQ